MLNAAYLGVRQQRKGTLQMYEIDKLRSFSSEHDYSSFSVVRIHPKVINQIGGRNTWVKICNGSHCVYRLALGAKSSKGFTHKSMEIDYDSCVELGAVSPQQEKDENNFYPCSLSLERASLTGKMFAHWHHPNPAYRAPMQLSIVSFFLGVVGLFLGILGYA